LVEAFGFSNKEYVFNNGNIGFGRAYNILIDKAMSDGADYFIALNPDVILDSRCLIELILVLDSKSSLGSVAPKILRWDFSQLVKTDYIDSCGIIMAPGLRFFDLGQGDRDSRIFDSAQILGPSGAAAAFRMTALAAVKSDEGYFDSRMFMYKEDCDLAYRLFLAGYPSKFVPSAIAYHDRSASRFGGRKAKSLAIRRWSWQNQRLIWKKYWSQQNLVNRLVIGFYFLAQYVWLSLFEREVLKK
jgi:hypothetical protein